MNRILPTVLAALVAASCAGAPPKPEKPMAQEPAKLPAPPLPETSPGVSRLGGQRIVLPSPATPLVSFRVAFQAGSIDDPQGQEGVTALAAALMAEGGTKSLTSAQLLEKLFPMAASIEQQTDKELTVFSGTVHRDHLDAFLAVFVEALTAPRWDPREFERLRDEALNDIEKRLRAGDDERLGKEALSGLIWEGHPYAHYEGGTVEALKALTLADVKAQAARVFTRDRMAIGLAGAVDDTLADRLAKALEPLPSQGAPLVALPAVQPRPPRGLLVKKEASSAALSFGYPYALTRRDPDFYPMMVAVSALGEHRQFVGRLMKELRVKRGLNYGNYAYIEHFEQAGWSTLPQPNVPRRHQTFTVWIRPVQPENGLFALRATLDEVDRFRQGLTQEEFDTIKGFLKGYTLLWEQTPMRRLAYAIDDAFYGTDNHLAGFRKALETMTLDDVNWAIARWIDASQLSVAIVTKDAEGLQGKIAQSASEPIAYPAPVDDAVKRADERIQARPLPFEGQLSTVEAAALFEQ